MGRMLLFGAVLWTGLVLSAVHIASADEAVSEVKYLECTGSSCGTEQVEWSSFTERAIFPGRKVLTSTRLNLKSPEKISIVSLGKKTKVTTLRDRLQPLLTELARAPPPPRKAPSGPTPYIIVPPSPSPVSTEKKPGSSPVSPGTAR